MVKKIVIVLDVFLSILSFSSYVTIVTSNSFNLSLSSWHLAFSVNQDQYLLGLNLIDYNKELITTVERQVFTKTIKMKMKTGDENAIFNVFFWQSPALTVVYKKTSIFPYKSETYMYFVASKNPVFIEESYQYAKFLGFSILSASLSMNDSGFSYGMYGYRDIYLGYFKTASGYIAGLGDMNGEYSGMLGAGFGKGISFGFGYFINKSKSLGFAGLSFDEGGIYPQVFVKWNFKMAELSLLYQNGRFLLSVHE
ncbi:MAG: hypothetical protein J7L34_03060 [Thermotogaceae bacterium]|nr:hypothetical protein [Thermotogaceae bacterium]